jgi:hypothetical protein
VKLLAVEETFMLKVPLELGAPDHRVRAGVAPPGAHVLKGRECRASLDAWMITRWSYFDARGPTRRINGECALPSPVADPVDARHEQTK